MNLKDFFRQGNKSFDDLLKQEIIQSECMVCKQPMTIVRAVAFDLEQLAKLQGCFECKNCGRHTCYDCSDRDMQCKCGATHWEQSSYVYTF